MIHIHLNLITGCLEIDHNDIFKSFKGYQPFQEVFKYSTYLRLNYVMLLPWSQNPSQKVPSGHKKLKHTHTHTHVNTERNNEVKLV